MAHRIKTEAYKERDLKARSRRTSLTMSLNFFMPATTIAGSDMAENKPLRFLQDLVLGGDLSFFALAVE